MNVALEVLPALTPTAWLHRRTPPSSHHPSTPARGSRRIRREGQRSRRSRTSWMKTSCSIEKTLKEEAKQSRKERCKQSCHQPRFSVHFSPQPLIYFKQLFIIIKVSFILALESQSVYKHLVMSKKISNYQTKMLYCGILAAIAGLLFPAWLREVIKKRPKKQRMKKVKVF